MGQVVHGWKFRPIATDQRPFKFHHFVLRPPMQLIAFANRRVRVVRTRSRFFPRLLSGLCENLPKSVTSSVSKSMTHLAPSRIQIRSHRRIIAVAIC